MLPVSVVIPFCRADKADAVRLLQWIAELGKVDARCYLMGPEECDLQSMLVLAYKAFSEATAWIDAEDIQSDWKNPEIEATKSAAGPNSIFRQIAWNMNVLQLGPWLFLEPDSVPMCKDWMEQLCAEYVNCQRPFMGCKVDTTNHPDAIGLPTHMSGVAIWPQRVPALAPKAVQPGSLAFDMMGAEQIVPQAAWTTKIMHRFRAPGFSSIAEVHRRISDECVLFHANKDGSLIPLLRERLSGYSAAPLVTFSGGPGVKVEPSKDISGFMEISIEKQPTCDIFIKTFEKDYEWLKYCLRSIQKYATGFRKVIVCSQCPPMGSPFSEMVREGVVGFSHEDERKPGYLWQQSVKLHADERTDADFIIFMDSDCLLTRPVTPADFLHDGKPIWGYSPNPRDDQQRTWFPVMEKFLGVKPTAEFMRRHPFCVTPAMLREMRQFCKYRHSVELSEYVMAQAVPANPLALTFSEWNCLGFFLHTHHPEMAHWVEEGSPEWKPDCVRQFWSHGGLKPEHRAEMECIIEGPYTKEQLMDTTTKWPCNESFKEMGALADECKRIICGSPVTLDGPCISITQEGAIDFLVHQASASNIAKARVLKAIKSAGLVKGGKLRTSPAKTPTAPASKPDDGFLLAIQSYPGGNEALARHWPYFLIAGASRIVVIGTTDHGCTAPDGIEIVEIGANKYIDGDHLPRRYVDILKWFMEQPEDRICIDEYDVLHLSPIKPWKGVCVVPAGGKLPKSKASSFFHCPHLIDKPSAKKLIVEMKRLIKNGESSTLPHSSPDVFLSLAIDRGCLPADHKHFTQFTRNSLDIPGDLELACKAARGGVDVIHGVKQAHELEAIVAALK